MTKVLGIERYKVLSAMLTLPEFTSADLSTHTGVKIDTVRSVVKREEHRYLTRVPMGNTESKQRGGQFVRYRLEPQKVKELRDEVEGLFAQVRDSANTLINDNEVALHPSLSALRGRPEMKRIPEDGDATTFAAEADTSAGPLPTSLRISENVLQALLPRARTDDEKRRLLQLVEFNIDSALAEIGMMEPGSVTGRLRACVGSVEFLHDLSLAELDWLPADRLLTLRKRYRDTKLELVKWREDDRLITVNERVLGSPVRDVVVPIPPPPSKSQFVPNMVSVASMAAVGSVSVGQAAGALNTPMGRDATETNHVIRVAMEGVERVRVIADPIRRFEACDEEANKARDAYKVDESSIVKVAADIRGGNRVRVSYELIRTLACEPAFYLKPAIQFAERGALLQGRSYVLSAEELRYAGRNPGKVAMRVIS